jgi:biopolymer transport protein ExbB/TolQ
MDGQMQFISVAGLTFAFIGMALLTLIILHIWILIVIARIARNTVRIIKRNQEAEKARKEIVERDKRRILRMIRRKATDEEWAQLLAELGEEDLKLTEGDQP